MALTQPETLHRIARVNLETALKGHRASEFQSALSSIVESVATGR
jgi:hypothetical protein